jgi:hypothetical protein
MDSVKVSSISFANYGVYLAEINLIITMCSRSNEHCISYL